MLMKYNHLLNPIRIGNHIIKNRMVYPNASPHFLQGPEDYPAEGYRAFVANLAKNGAAIINVAEWDNPDQRKFPVDMDISHMQSFNMKDPAVHNYQSQMAEEVHFYGSKLIITLNYEMPEGYSLNGGFAPFAPGGGVTKPIPVEMISEAIEKNVQKAKMYKLLGFDGMSVRCDSDIIPTVDPRQDKYGGNIENRTRFIREWMMAVKKELGNDFIIEGVVAWEQPDGYGPNTRVLGGYFETDTIQFIKETEGIIDLLQIRENNVCTSHPTGYCFTKGVHPALEFASKMKTMGVKMLMEPIGGYQDPEEMDEAIKAGKCDLFGVARAFLSDYEYGKKLYEGRGADVVPCLRCNKCHGTILPEHEPWLSVCSVNPLMGKSAKIGRMLEGEDGTKKKVAIIGGGPAGMRASLYAVEKGHSVTLFEKTNQLGGQLFHSDYFSFKWPVRDYKNWLIDQIQKSAVEIRMSTEPTPEGLKEEGYDVILAATGAVNSVPFSIDGLRNEDGSVKETTKTCLDILGHEKSLGKHVIICGGSEVAVETAMYLCENGHDVTILTRQKEIGHNCSKLHYITCAWIKRNPDGTATESPAWEQYENLKGIVNVHTHKVDGGTVWYEDANGKEHSITGDNVIICGGMHPLMDEAMKYAGISNRFYAIGDCNGAGNLQKCNEEAYARTMIL